MHTTPQELARALDARLHLRQADEPYEALRLRAPAPATLPALQLDDVSGIPFLQDILGIENYQLRAMTRAREGDLVIGTCPPMEDYARYHAHTLGLGQAHYTQIPFQSSPITLARCALDAPAVLQSLAQAAQARGQLLIHPYMGIAPVWELAQALSRLAQVPLQVLAPPPAVTWLANDKLHLHESVEALLGPRWLVDTRWASDAPALATHLRLLASRHRRVALKMTRCASAMGNRVWTAAQLQAMDEPTLLQTVQSFLRDKEWTAPDPVLAVSWEDVTSSPSSQLWIPPLGHGQPRLEGLYEQLLEGESGVFQGSIPSRLSEEIHAQMERASLTVARLYQELGYVGRCSFDFIVVGDQVKFVECNGRWGGTSTPMSLLDRLFPQGRPAYRVRDVVLPHLRGHTLQQVLDALGEDLWRADRPGGRFVLYNVAGIPGYGKLDVIALGDTPEDALDALETRFMERMEALR